MLKELVMKNRSVRRFYQEHRLTKDELRDFISLVRLTPSAANLQPLKYYLSADDDMNKKIFSTLAWAGYLSDWEGPAEGERPSAYIVILGDNSIKENIDCDHGIAAQTIMLAATEKGLGGCIIAAIDKIKLAEILSLPENFQIKLVLALGKPKEKVVLEEIGDENDIRYWRDKDGVHHVPKRSLSELIIS